MGKAVTLFLSDLTVNYASQVALANVSAQLTGNIIAVIGANGSGKSTLIKTILQLLEPMHGSAQILADGMALLPERDMAFSPENGAVFADLTVESYIKLWCRIKQHDPKYYLGAGRQYLELLEVQPLLRKLGRELSKGQRRRVQTLVGFICNPRFFLFDEPFEGLDIEQSRILTEIMRTESEQRALFISSHRMDIVERLADQVLVLDGGKLAAAGTVAEVVSQLGAKVGPATTLIDAMAAFLAAKGK